VITTSPEAAARTARRAKALDALGRLPPFSPILNRLLATLTGEDVPFSKLADLIEKDTTLTGNLLQIVNSALYARRGTVVSVRHAISLLGLTKLRNATLAMSISRMWNRSTMPASWSMTRFNTHSAACGVLSDLLAQRLPVDCGEGAFVAGLLHDVGHMLIALSLPVEHEEILRRRSEGVAGIEAEREILGFTHADLSAEAVAHWHLPPEVRKAVLHHHESHLAQAQPGSPEIALSRVVEAANNYLNFAKISVFALDSPDAADPAWLEALLPDAERRAAALAEFKAEFDLMLQFFN
jgi:HD-like signal output (HDOD) protein